MNDRDTGAMRNALMVAYLYPPVENPGTRRSVKFAKYLPEFGYHPIVLTTRTRGALPDDAQNDIYRADDLLGYLKRGYRALKLRNVPQEQRANIALMSYTSPLLRWQAAVLPPDNEVLWYPLAVQRGREILRSRRIDVLYSTSGPETDHLVALKLKRESGLPWVADFRDGWMFEPLRSIRQTSSLRRAVESRMEQRVVTTADCVVTVNEVIAEYLRERYPAAASRVRVITNGYDANDFAGLTRSRVDRDRFRIVHTGSLWGSEASRSVDGLLTALERLRDRNAPVIQQLEIVLVGRLWPAEVEAIGRAGLSDLFSMAGQVEYRASLQQQLDADVLLLVTSGGTRGVSTSKLYEYLAAGRFILALTGQSAAADLIASTGAGVAVDPNDVEGIATTLETLYAQWRADTLPEGIGERARRFDRRELTKSLAAIFDSLSADRRHLPRGDAAP